MATRKSADTASRSSKTRSDTPEEPRFVYHGHAVGAAGRIVRVDPDCGLNEILPVQAASSLPVIGGVSESVVDHPSELCVAGRPMFWLSRARTLAETPAGAWATSVRAEAHGLHVLGDAIIVDHVRAEIATEHPRGDPYPRIHMGDCGIDGLQIAGVPVRVDIDKGPFRPGCTKQAIEELIRQDSKFAARIGWRHGRPRSKGVAECHIIKKVTFDRKRMPEEVMYDPDPAVRNRIVWHGVGTIFLGEMLVSDYSRRLTMVRIALGSPVEGDFAVGEVETDGHTMP